MQTREITHFHLFCGLGGGAKGFNRGEARMGPLEARFRCLGGIDVDRAAIADFSRAAKVPGTVLDLFSREQYEAFHGRSPAPDWRESTTADIHRAAQFERPNIVFLSAPCKGFSGLLAEKASKTPKYAALNELTLRGVWLMLEAWAGDPPELIVFENVPRIASRGRPLLDKIVALLRHYGYAVAETTHDCGELGGLGQSRKRFLLVARHTEKVPPFLYEPPLRSLKSVGDVLERFPMPGDGGGPMHRLPLLQWKTWVRLAFVEAGADWRSLNRLRVENGVLADYGIAPGTGWHSGVMGVHRWDDTSGTVTGHASPTTGAFSVADPRVDGHPKSVQLGVRPWNKPAPVVTSKMLAGGGPHSIADPRVGATGPRFNNVYRVVRFDQPSPAVTAGAGPTAGGIAVADPRTAYGPNSHRNKLAVVGWGTASRTVTGGSQVQGGALSVADPRPDFARYGRSAYLTGGHYGVVRWDGTAGGVTAAGQHDNGRWSVADPRAPADAADRPTALPAPDTRIAARIVALDGTWHRPFTTLELAALQGLVEPEEHLELEGLSDAGWRERIGNAVPPPAAQAIASTMGRTLLLSWTGQSFVLSNEPIWVRPMVAALMAAR